MNPFLEDMKINGRIPNVAVASKYGGWLVEGGIDHTIMSYIINDLNNLAKKMGVQHELECNQYLLKRFRRLRELIERKELPEDHSKWLDIIKSRRIPYLHKVDHALYRMKDTDPMLRELWELTARPEVEVPVPEQPPPTPLGGRRRYTRRLK